MVDPYSNRPDRRPGSPLAARGADPLDQRLDRWMAAGRQLVDGVSGARPGSRAVGRGRPGGRGSGRPSLEGLGRWVEDRLDWLLEDEDDWREPWQQERMANRPVGGAADLRMPRREQAPSPWEEAGPGSSGVRSADAGRVASGAAFGRDDAVTAGRRGSQEPAPASARTAAGVSSRRPLEAMSRRESRRRDVPDGDWPQDDAFQVPRWQRPARSAQPPPVADLVQRPPASESVAKPMNLDRTSSLGNPGPPAPEADRGSGRPLPRSSRRRS